MTQKIGLDQGIAGPLSEVRVVADCENLVGDGSILPPISVNIAHVVDGKGFDLWNGARAWAVWSKANAGKPKGDREPLATAPIQVPEQVWAYLYKAGAKAEKALGKDASMEAMEVAGQKACVVSWNKLVLRLKDSTYPSPRRLWDGIVRTVEEMDSDDNCCYVGQCPRAKKGLHWRINVGDSTIAAHRLALTLSSGICPVGMLALHRCGYPPCINPTHLRWGSAKQNRLDRARDTRAFRSVTWARVAKLRGIKVVTTAQRLREAKATLQAVARSQGWRM